MSSESRKRPPELVYFETSMVLALLKKEPGRVEMCEAAFRDAQTGRITAITSAFTLAEVVKIDDDYLPEAVEAKINAFFQHSWFRVAGVDGRVGTLARRVAREHGLKPPDATHVATALLYKATAIYTYDDKILAMAGGIPGLNITHPLGQLLLAFGETAATTPRKKR